MGARHRRGNQFLNGAQKYNRLHCKLDFPLRQCLTQLAAHFSCLWMWATAECLPCARAGTELRVGLLPTITVPINWNIHLLERLWSSQVREWSALCIHYFSGEGALLCAFYSLTESVCLACSCFFFFSSFRRGGGQGDRNWHYWKQFHKGPGPVSSLFFSISGCTTALGSLRLLGMETYLSNK